MAAQFFNLAVERKCRAMTQGLAKLKAEVAAMVEASKATDRRLIALQEAREDRDMDPRARALIAALRSHFAGCDGVLVELDYVKSLLKPTTGDVQ